MQQPASDPRPLVGEPLAVDLLNTVWRDAHGEHDLLSDTAGLELWLTVHEFGGAPVSEATRLALVEAREALRRHVVGLLAPATAPPASAVADLNAVLAHGGLARHLEDGGPATRIVVDDPARLPAWTAVEDYLQLLARDKNRLRRCGDAACVLHFFDVSKRGDRRWCSMAGCGNRAKAARHYARTRQA